MAPKKWQLVLFFLINLARDFSAYYLSKLLSIVNLAQPRITWEELSTEKQPWSDLTVWPFPVYCGSITRRQGALGCVGKLAEHEQGSNPTSSLLPRFLPPGSPWTPLLMPFNDGLSLGSVGFIDLLEVFPHSCYHWVIWDPVSVWLC